MSSQPGEYNNKRTWMPDDAEREKLERRLVRAISSGRTMWQLRQSFKLSEAIIKSVAKANGLTIAKGPGSGGYKL